MISYDWISYLLGSPASFADLFGMSRPLFRSALFWFTALLIPIVCLLRDFIWKFYQRQFMPQEYHIVQELQREEKYSLSRPHLTVDSTASTTMGPEKVRSRSLTVH